MLLFTGISDSIRSSHKIIQWFTCCIFTTHSVEAKKEESIFYFYYRHWQNDYHQSQKALLLVKLHAKSFLSNDWCKLTLYCISLHYIWFSSGQTNQFLHQILFLIYNLFFHIQLSFWILVRLCKRFICVSYLCFIYIYIYRYISKYH